MTRAEMILSLLREQPRTFEQLVEVTGLSDPIVRTTLSDLRRNGYMEPVPTTYVATEKAGQGGKPKIDWNAQKRQVKQSRPEKKAPPMHSVSMVEKSIRSNPNSVFAMGAMA
jgi:DNA-binding transcriptional ArsR family regulator